jgi:GntR family histidine utilization transcriptional repressor
MVFVKDPGSTSAEFESSASRRALAAIVTGSPFSCDADVTLPVECLCMVAANSGGRSGRPAHDTSARARFERIRQHVLQRLQDPHIRPGSPTLSAEALAQELQVPAAAVRRVYTELTCSGYIRHVAGVGTVVVDAWAQDERVRIKHIAVAIAAAGLSPSSEVITRGRIAAAQARALGFIESAHPFYTSVVHYGSGMPIQFSEWWVSSKAFPGYSKSKPGQTRPIEHLRRTAPSLSVSHQVEAMMPSQEARLLLQMRATDPCLKVVTRVEAEGQLLAIGHEYHPGSRYALPDRIICVPKNEEHSRPSERQADDEEAQAKLTPRRSSG